MILSIFQVIFDGLRGISFVIVFGFNKDVKQAIREACCKLFRIKQNPPEDAIDNLATRSLAESTFGSYKFTAADNNSSFSEDNYKFRKQNSNNSSLN